MGWLVPPSGAARSALQRPQIAPLRPSGTRFFCPHSGQARMMVSVFFVVMAGLSYPWSARRVTFRPGWMPQKHGWLLSRRQYSAAVRDAFHLLRHLRHGSDPGVDADYRLPVLLCHARQPLG